jgi:CDP-4-dehydro-6-deoxyglucose reductase
LFIIGIWINRMIEIKLNNVTFEASDEKTIFQNAIEQSILINHSCLTGRCSSCKAKVKGGTTKAIENELGLSDDDKSHDYILTCVRKPTSNLILDLDVIIGVNIEKPKTIPVKIQSVALIKTDVIKLVLRYPPKVYFNFLPGQYINIIKADIKRSYSIGGIDASGNLVFYIKNYENGKMSNYLFNSAKENDLLRIEGPLGSFFLRENSLENIVFLATGTGIAPILSMLSNEVNKTSLKNKNVYLFHGGRYETDLLEKDILKEFNISYIPVLSREKRDNFFYGYVQDIVINQRIDLENTSVYACGSNNMIEDAKLLLLKNGLHRNQFYSDAFLESN